MRDRKASQKTQLKQFSVYLDMETAQFVVQQAHQLNLTESAYIRQLIKDYQAQADTPINLT